MQALTVLALTVTLAFASLAGTAAPQAPKAGTAEGMQLGTFSVSLAVKDIHASKAFYEKLGFAPVGGKLEQKWLVLQNGSATIGLFQGMFEKNILTFNPGWSKSKEALADFQDVRELQRILKERGIELTTEADAATTGPASFTTADPDGNMILFDQHVPSPKR